jgi:hypothetical protein
MMNKMSILTVLVIGIAMAVLVSPVVAYGPCGAVGIKGTVKDSAGNGLSGWHVHIDVHYPEYGGVWWQLIDTDIGPSGSFQSDPLTVPCTGVAGIGSCEVRNYRIQLIDTEDELVYDDTINGADMENYVAQPYIPEFSTIAIPVVSILGLLFFFNYRKRRGNK